MSKAVVLALCVALFGASSARANAGGVTGYSGQTQSCTSCHAQAATGNPGSAAINGPASLVVGSSGTYTLTISGGPAVDAGFDVAVDNTNATLSAVSPNGRILNKELVHANPPPAFSSGAFSVQFKLTAPANPGTVKLYAAAMSSDGALTTGDRTLNLVVPVTINANKAPVVSSPAASDKSTAYGQKVNLSVLGTDDTGEGALTYTWSTVGTPPAPVTFSVNGNNAAKNATATFSKIGAYTFQCVIKDPNGATTSSSVNVNVAPSLWTFQLTPKTVTVLTGRSFTFTTVSKDQFGAAMTPSIAWNVDSGAGSIDAAGTLTAATVPGGPFTVTAIAGGKTGTATVNVQKPPDATWLSPANGTTVTGKVDILVQATDDERVTQVDFLVDGNPVGIAVTEPWKMPLDTTQFTNGPHTLNAIAKDPNGNEGQAGELTLTFDNGAFGKKEPPPAEEPRGCAVTGFGAPAILAAMALLRTRRRKSL